MRSWRRALVAATSLIVLVVTGCSSESSDPTPVITLPPTTAPTSTTAPSSTTTTVAADPEAEPPVAVPVGTDIAALVVESEPGTAFLIAGGVHRMQQIEPKDGMSFVGEDGAVLNGAMELDGFTLDGEGWTVSGLERDDTDHGMCIDGYEACAYPQDLFMDDVMLWQVTDVDDLGPGRWMWDDADTIRVFDNPNGRRVELSLASHAFVGSASDVTIRGLVVEKYATRAQSGAIQAQQPGDGERGSGWIIDGVEARLNHAAGIRTGDATIVRNTTMHHNGQMGLAVSGGTDVLIEDSEIADNNIAGFRWGWEAGGMKATRTLRLTVRNVHAHDNFGPGLWTDIDARDTVYENNVVQDNAGPGIFHEISYDALITGNLVERNGFDNPDWLWGAGILIAASSGVEVRDNVVRDNADGIAAIQQDRGDGAYGPRIVQDLFVHGNEISVTDGGHIGVVQDIGDDAIFDGRNNRFEGNTYVGVSGDVFAWNNRFVDRTAWVRSGQDPNGEFR